jgi:hypothetical protein
LTEARPPARPRTIDWLNVAVWIGGVFGPWLLVLGTVAFLEGWL